MHRTVGLTCGSGAARTHAWQALPADVEQEERRLLQLYVPLLKLYQQQGATGDQERWRLQLEVVVALQEFSAANDNPVCTF